MTCPPHHQEELGLIQPDSANTYGNYQGDRRGRTHHNGSQNNTYREVYKYRNCRAYDPYSCADRARVVRS